MYPLSIWPRADDGTSMHDDGNSSSSLSLCSESRPPGPACQVYSSPILPELERQRPKLPAIYRHLLQHREALRELQHRLRGTCLILLGPSSLSETAHDVAVLMGASYSSYISAATRMSAPPKCFMNGGLHACFYYKCWRETRPGPHCALTTSRLCACDRKCAPLKCLILCPTQPPQYDAREP